MQQVLRSAGGWWVSGYQHQELCWRVPYQPMAVRAWIPI